MSSSGSPQNTGATTSPTTSAATWAAQCARHAQSDSPAVVTADSTWSYRDLTRKVHGWAGWLRELDLEPGAPVPCLVGSSPEIYALWLAGAVTGHPLMPLGARLTPGEIAACLRDSDPDVLVVEPAHREVGAAVAAVSPRRLVLLDSAPEAGPEARFEVEPGAIAMVLHTSGTTGRPKRVPFRHDRMAIRNEIYAELLGLTQGSVYSSSQQFHHLGGAALLAVALAAGAAVVPPTPRFTGAGWRELGRLGVTHGTLVPTMIERLLDSGDLPFPSLRVITYGASSIRPETARRMVLEHRQVGLLQGYAQTEGGPLTALTQADHAWAALHAPQLLASAGRPVPGVELVIDTPDEAGVGEVWARGPHLAQPSEDGWLRTGDLGHLDADGYLFLAGRKGDMIIRGGENVYPDEIETLLSRHPGVREAGVVGVPDPALGERVAAFVVPADPGAPPDPADLRSYLREQVSGFKVPTQWEVVDDLPRGALGKLLRRELRAGLS